MKLLGCFLILAPSTSEEEPLLLKHIKNSPITFGWDAFGRMALTCMEPRTILSRSIQCLAVDLIWLKPTLTSWHLCITTAASVKTKELLKTRSSPAAPLGRSPSCYTLQPLCVVCLCVCTFTQSVPAVPFRNRRDVAGNVTESLRKYRRYWYDLILVGLTISYT